MGRDALLFLIRTNLACSQLTVSFKTVLCHQLHVLNFGVLGFNVNVNLSHFYEHIKASMTWETKLNKSCIKLCLHNNKIRQLLKCSFYHKQEFVSQTNILSAMKSTYKIALNARTGLIM